MCRLVSIALLSALLVTVPLFASDASVKRNVHLRAEPTTASKSIVILKPGDELQLIDDNPTDGFYHVRTDDGDEGWVWSKNVSITAAEETSLGLSAASIASKISDGWDKPTPNKTTFKGPEGSCPWNGDDSDPDTFVRKNRTDIPTSVHDVAWTALHDLEFPKDVHLRKNWSPEHIHNIGQYEGAAIRTIGYLVAAKPQNHGHGEGTNCHFTQAVETDTHLALVGSVGDAEKNSVVIEFTPRFLKAHPNWRATKLKDWVDSDKPIRVTGWLMLDPDHRNHLNKYRYTLWEIHPITKFEVSQDGAWVDLDTLH